MNFNRPLFECFLRIRNLPEMAPFRAFLTEEVAKAAAAVIAQDKTKQILRAQGAARKLEELQKLIMDSDKVLEQRSQQPLRRPNE